MLPSPQSCNSPRHLVAYFLSAANGRVDAYCSKEVATRMLRDYVQREINVLLWLFLIFAMCLLGERFVRVWELWSRARRIPGPPCSSFFGNSNFGFWENFDGYLSKLHDKYGPILKLWLSPLQLFVSFNDPSLVCEILSKAEDKFPCSVRALRMVYGESNIFFCSYEKAKPNRDSLEFELNKNLDFKSAVIPDNVIDSIIERIEGCMLKGRVDSKRVSQQMAFCILGSKIFGDSFLDWPYASLYEDHLSVISKDASHWSSYRVTPFLQFDFWSYLSLCNRLKHLTENAARKFVDNCIFFHKTDESLNSCTDKTSVKTSFGEEACGNIMGAMFHGCLAMASLISSILERLASESKLQNEIYLETKKMSVKQDKKVQNMALLLAFIYEAARLAPTKPLLQRCSLRRDLTLKNGVSIPAGAMIIVPVRLQQTNDHIWGNEAAKFNPHRLVIHTDSSSDLSHGTDGTHYTIKEPISNASFLPFGSGARACVAQKFVIQAVASLFSSLLERFEVRPSEDSSEPSVVRFVRRND